DLAAGAVDGAVQPCAVVGLLAGMAGFDLGWVAGRDGLAMLVPGLCTDGGRQRPHAGAGGSAGGAVAVAPPFLACGQPARTVRRCPDRAGGRPAAGVQRLGPTFYCSSCSRLLAVSAAGVLG